MDNEVTFPYAYSDNKLYKRLFMKSYVPIYIILMVTLSFTSGKFKFDGAVFMFFLNFIPTSIICGLVYVFYFLDKEKLKIAWIFDKCDYVWDKKALSGIGISLSERCVYCDEAGVIYQFKFENIVDYGWEYQPVKPVITFTMRNMEKASYKIKTSSCEEIFARLKSIL